MGYKSVIRSVSASANKSSREYDKRVRAEQREELKLEKKVKSLEDKKEKILGTLKDLYAKGKVSEEEYSKLLKRDVDIKYPLLCFGKGAGVSLAKRYICGSIDIDEFSKIERELIPDGVFDEQEYISSSIEKQKALLKSFKKESKNEIHENCQKCSKKKSFFSPLKDYAGLNLCGSCKKEYVLLETYEGFTGEFFNVGSVSVESSKINVNLRSEHL